MLRRDSPEPYEDCGLGQILFRWVIGKWARKGRLALQPVYEDVDS
jgi:hypothetical protein